MLAHHRTTEEDLWGGARCNSAAHVVRQERESDLIRGVHPAESFAGYHFEIDPLIAVLGIDEVRESDRVEFLRYHAVKIDERSRHHV